MRLTSKYAPVQLSEFVGLHDRGVHGRPAVRRDILDTVRELTTEPKPMGGV